MIPRFYSFVVVNNSGQTLSYDANGRLNLKVTGFIIDPDTGKVTYSVLSDDDFGFGSTDTLSDGAELESTEIDNTSNLYTGLLVQLEVTHDEGAAADGRFDLYLSAGDATGEKETDASGYDDAETSSLEFVGYVLWQSAMADDEVGRSRLIEL